MNRTENYQLPKWEKTDRVMMEDFNDMTDKLDKGLAEEKKARENTDARVDKCGNCRIVYQTYQGNGQYGDSNRTRLTFAGKPRIVVVMNAAEGSFAVMVQSCTAALINKLGNTFSFSVTWSGSTVSMSADTAAYQFNESGRTYLALALLDKEA